MYYYDHDYNITPKMLNANQAPGSGYRIRVVVQGPPSRPAAPRAYKYIYDYMYIYV